MSFSFTGVPVPAIVRSVKRPRTVQRRIPAGEVSTEGVDRSLVRWTLSLSPRQRLQVLEEHLRGVRALRRDTAAK